MTNLAHSEASIGTSADLLQELFSHLHGPGALSSQLARLLDADESHVRSACASAAPLVLGAFVSYGSSLEGATDLLRIIGEGGFGSSSYRQTVDMLGSTSSSSALLLSGAHLLEHLFGAKLPQVQSTFSAYAGLKRTAGATILQTLAPLIAGSICYAVRERGLTAAGCVNLLRSQREIVASTLPFRLAALRPLLGLSEGDTFLAPRDPERSAVLGSLQLLKLAASICAIVLAFVALYRVTT